MTEAKGTPFTRYFPVLLDALRSAAPRPMRPADAFAWIRRAVDVSEADISRRIVGDSQTIFENQVHWARFYLAKAGLVASPKRGLWGLTPAGRETHLTPESTWELYVRVRDANRPGRADEGTTPPPEGDPAADGPSFWFAGAVWNGTEDQTERFRAEGVWHEGGRPDRDQVFIRPEAQTSLRRSGKVGVLHEDQGHRHNHGTERRRKHGDGRLGPTLHATRLVLLHLPHDPC
jgi:hypothetical protein